MNKNGTKENLKKFKKGKSGNPNGRPKGAITKPDLRAMVREWRDATASGFYEEATLIINEIISSGMLSEAIFSQLRKGNMAGFELLLHYIIGKPDQVIDLKSTDGSMTPQIKINKETKNLIIERLSELDD